MTRPVRTRPQRTRRPRVTTLPQLIANAVETNPDGVALVLADGTGPLEQVSYADLDAWSSRLARALTARGIGPEDLVAVAIPRSLDAVLAVWAVAKTGAGFVPIDPSYPPSWVAHLLTDAGAVYGLAVSWVRNELPEEVEWLQVDTVDTARSLEQFSADAVTYADRVRPLRAEHPAYVTYVADAETLPDGVVVTQAGLSGLCGEQQGRYRVEPEDRTLNFAPLPSDSSVLELLLALGGAATMVVVSPLVSRADELAALVQRTGVTHAYLPAEALELLDPTGLDELGVVIAGRRPCPPELVQRWAVPVAGGSFRSVYQGYGPAEVTVMTGISSPLTPGSPLTLGAPIRGVTAHVLDERLHAVPDGAVGELYLGGLQLARGYHRRPGRTAQLLVADPVAGDGSRLYRTGDLVRRGPGGAMEYVGRVRIPAFDGLGALSPRHPENTVAGAVNDVASTADVNGVPAAGSVEYPSAAENYIHPATAGVGEYPAAVNVSAEQESPAGPDGWPAADLPDYERSLPIREPGPQSEDAAQPGGGFGPEFGAGTVASPESEPVSDGAYESASPGVDPVSAPAGADTLPEPGSRLASQQPDMELRGRGYLDMPDRRQPLPGRAAQSVEAPSEPSAAGPSEPAPVRTSETAEAVDPSASEPGSSQPGLPTAREPQRTEDPADAWLRSGHQLPGPPDPAPMPSPRGDSPSIPRDATAFYENPLAGDPEPEQPATRGPAVPIPAAPLSGRPDWAVPPAWSAAEPEPPSVSDDPPPAEPGPADPPSVVERPSTVPLSAGQLRWWEHNRTAPTGTAETITAAMRLTGNLDATAMQAAVADVIDRHETLRTVYPAIDGMPQQVVLPREHAVPEVVAEPVPAEALGEWLYAISQTDFDVADAEQVPVRFALAESGPREHVVAVVVHRILADDVSAGLLLRDLLRAFLGRRNRSRPLWQPLTVQYLDYFLGRRAELGELTDPESLAARQLAYWRDYLADLPPRLEIPAETDGAAGPGVHTFDIGTRIHRRVIDIAERAGTSEFIVLRAAFAVLLARSSALADIVLGSSVRGRDERELDDALGPYTNTVVLRTRIDPAESFVDLVHRVAESDRRAFANADLPFETLTAALGVEGPLFDAAVALRHDNVPRLNMPSLVTEPVELADAPVDAVLQLIVDPHRAADGSPDGIAAAFHFAQERIGASAVAEFARRFQRVLTVAGGDPDGPVGDIDLLSRADLDRLLVVWNDTRYPVTPELLLDGYRRTVAVRPDTVAVTDAETELSYRQFDARVNRLARRLIEAGVGAETVVGIATRRTPDLVVAIYAVLTAGGAYLPLDPRDPAAWTAQILDTATPALLLTDRASRPRLGAALRAARHTAPVMAVDVDDLDTYSGEPVHPTETVRPARPGNTACVLCVSVAAEGPELAALSHAALNNQITLMLAQTPLGFADVYLQRNAPTAVTSLWGFFLPLRAGAELVLTGPVDARQIADIVSAHGVTVTDFGPAELARFAELQDPARVGSLREIFVTGAPVAPEIVSALRTWCSAQVHHLYGTGETAVSATSWPAAGSAEPSVPIGLPQWNTRVYVLDSRLRPVPPGVPGELYLAGDQLARGYAGRAAATADRFVANPFGYGQRMFRTGDLVVWRDATSTTPQRLHLLGRTDHQIRFRGHRIRPKVLAAALRTLPGVADAAVLARTGAAGNDPTAPGSRLTAYVVPETGTELGPEQVRAGLAELLPTVLLPVAFRAVEQIPLRADGRPDSDRLPDPDEVPALPALPEPGPGELDSDDFTAEPIDAHAVGRTGPGAGGPSSAGTAAPVGEPVGADLPGTDAVPPAGDVAEGAVPASALPRGADEIGAAERESSTDTGEPGELPATPTVVRLLDNPLPGVEVRAIVLDLPADRPLEHTEAVVRALVARHPMLTARLVDRAGTPALVLSPPERRGDQQYWWLEAGGGEIPVATDDVVQAAADNLDPATGSNIHFVVAGPESARRLVVVANGLVVDDRSWRVIVDELLAGDTGAPVTESRVSQLVQLLDQRARSLSLLDEAGWWRQNLAGARTAAPLGSVDLRPRRRVSLAITAEGTAAVTAAADVYRATVPEVLLTAVAIALRTDGRGAVAATLGSLVRIDADARSLVSRGDDLVGGFVSEFPLSVQVGDIDTTDALVGGPAAGSALTRIRDLVRSVPDGGAGYALLRYVSAETSAEFAAADSGRFTLRYRDLRPARVHTDGPADTVPMVLTVDATDEGLLCRFDYATEVFIGDEVKTFAEHWVRALGGLAEHGLRPAPAPSSPLPSAPTPNSAPSVANASTAADPNALPASGSQQATGRGVGPDQGAMPPHDTDTTSDPRRGTSSARYGSPDPTASEALPSHSDSYPSVGAENPAPGSADASSDPHPPTPDAEVTSLLRPITDPPRPPVAGRNLPQRRRRTTDSGRGESESVAGTRSPLDSTPGEAADRPTELGATGLPQRAARSAEPGHMPPAPSPSRPDLHAQTGDEPSALSSSPRLPQQPPRLHDGPLLPEPSSATLSDAGAPADEPSRGTEPAGIGGLAQRRARDGAPESSAQVSDKLPQRRPQLPSDSPESGGLPQRRPQGDSVPSDSSPGGGLREPWSPRDGSSSAGTSGGSGLPQRRPQGDRLAPDSPVSSELPQRRPPEGAVPSDPPVDSGIPQRVSQDGPTSAPSSAEVDEPAVPPSAGLVGGPQDGGDGPGSEAEEQPPASPLAGLVGGPQVGGAGVDAEGEADAPISGGLPQRRPTVRAGEGADESAGSSSLPGLPQRRPQPGPVSLPQRRPAPDENAAPAEFDAGPEPTPGPVPPALPQRRPGSVSRPESDDAAAGRPQAPLPQRSANGTPAAAEPESTADPEPTTYLRPVPDVETTAYLAPIRDGGPQADDTTLLTLFDEQVARTPAEPAVRQGARLLGYAELDRKSRTLSAELVRFGVGAQTPVAVAMRPGIDLVVAVCAVLRAGGAYVPVDPDGSAADIDTVLSAAQPICVLSISDDGVRTDTGVPVVAIDLLYLDLPTDPAADPLVVADDIADIRYRPGTGTGVAATHRQMVERLRRAQRSHPYDSADLVLHAAPTIGDITLWELFRPLHSGAQILMPDHPGRAADLSRSIAAHKVTIVHVVPGLLDRFLDSVTDGGGQVAHPSLRRLVVDGAALPSGGVERFMNLLPEAELVIWYGHDETGVITVGSVGSRPVTNDRVYLLDDDLRPVPPGTAGEMYIGGPQLADGFYESPGETAVRFVATAGGGRLYRTGDIVRRRDGVLEYLGRVERHGGSLPVGSRRGGHD